MLFSTPGGGLFSRAPPFVKTLGIHVHRLRPGGSSFVKSTPKPVHQTEPVPHPGVLGAVHPSGAEISCLLPPWPGVGYDRSI